MKGQELQNEGKEFTEMTDTQAGHSVSRGSCSGGLESIVEKTKITSASERTTEISKYLNIAPSLRD